MRRLKWMDLFWGAFLLALGAAVLIPVGYMALGVLREPGSLYQILLRRPDYLMKFWKSLALGAVIVAVNLAVSCLGGFAFAHFSFRGKGAAHFLLIVLMMMPVQVTLVPNYIILDRLHLLDTWAALALPCIFNPFGTVLMAQVFRSVPGEILDAARVDGAGTGQVLWKILVPTARGGAVSLILLTFVDVWNMVEQPMVFLRDPADYPLSVFLAVMNESGLSLSLAGGLLSMLPVLLLFLYFRDELAEGVGFLGLK